MFSSGFSSSSSFRPAVEKTSPGMKASRGKGWGPGKSIHSSAKTKTLPLINVDLTDQKGYKNSPRSAEKSEKLSPQRTQRNTETGRIAVIARSRDRKRQNLPRSHGDTEKAKPFTTEGTEEHRDFKNANHEIRKF